MIEANNYFFNNLYSFKDFCLLDETEIKTVWEWRNHIVIRQWMYDKSFIDFENHLKFIESLKKTDIKKYWLVKRKNINVGVFSLVNIETKQGELGFYLAPEFHKILSIEFYYYSLHHLFESFGINKIYGFTNKNNTSANSLNDLFGFTKNLVQKEISGGVEEYYIRELTAAHWGKNTIIDKKIIRLLYFSQRDSRANTK